MQSSKQVRNDDDGNLIKSSQGDNNDNNAQLMFSSFFNKTKKLNNWFINKVRCVVVRYNKDKNEKVHKRCKDPEVVVHTVVVCVLLLDVNAR